MKKTINNYESVRRTGIINDSVKSYVTDSLIYTIERQVLTTVLSRQLYLEIVEQVNNNNVIEDYQVLIDDFISPSVAYRLKAELLIECTFNLRSSGVQPILPDKTSQLSIKDVKELQDNYIEKSQWYLSELQRYIESNLELYPEYRVITNGADEVISVDNYKCPIYIPNRKKRC